MIKLNSSFEGEIVKYYDLYFLPKEKVINEVQYILDSCKQYMNNYDACLDIGSGTGAYDELFSEHFGKVVGIDLSKDMVAYANKYHTRDNITYFHKDARCCQVILEDFSADLAVSLAHVVGYQLDNHSLEKYFITVAKNLCKGGLFWFNFYNQPALFLSSLSPRYIKITDNGCSINRISNASIDADYNCLNMDYYYIVTDSEASNFIEIHEKMRYYTKLELEYYLEKTGFEIINVFNYKTNDPLSCSNWNGGILARKII